MLVYFYFISKNLTDRLDDAIAQLERDKRFMNNPVNRILYRQDMQEVSRDAISNLHVLPVTWQYWPRISLTGVQQYLDQQDIISPDAKGPYAVLKAFLRKVGKSGIMFFFFFCFLFCFVLFCFVLDEMIHSRPIEKRDKRSMKSTLL